MRSVGGPPPLPKLPIWDVVGLAYSDYFQNFTDVLWTCWLWLSLGMALVAMMSWQQWSLMGVAIANSINHIPPQPDFDMTTFRTLWLTLGGTNVVVILASLSIAVAWHRRIILSERPVLASFNIATRSYWRYIGVGLAILGLAILPILLVAAFLIFTVNIAKGGQPFIAIVVALSLIAAYVAAIAIVLRLSVLLPARAAGDFDLNFARSWNRTRGNCWRIFGGGLICTMAPMMVAEMLLLPMGMPNPATILAEGAQAIPTFLASGSFAARMTAISTIFTALYLLTLPIGVGFLSFAYRHFFREAISPTL